QAIELARVWLEAQRAYDQIPGVSAAIVHDQTILWSGGYGFGDLAAGREAGAGTVYSVCSISKLFTSIAVMQQRDAGRLRLDDAVAAHLPWFKIAPTEGESVPVTIEGLLTHASGLPRESEHPYWTGPTFVFPTRQQIIDRLAGQRMLYPSEAVFQYSNLGLTLAGEVAAAVAGEPYDVLVRRRILDPLGLSSTTSEMPAGLRDTRLATGYSGLGREGRRQPVPFFTANGVAPAAGYASTVDDLARFASWQFRLLSKGGTEVLKATTLREMQRVHWVDADFKNSWGLGFSVWRDDDKTFVGHGGSCPGFVSMLQLKTDERVATVFMANAQDVDAEMYAKGLYDIVGPVVAAAAKEKDGGKPSDAGDVSLDAYTGSYDDTFSNTETAIVRWEDGLAMLSLPTEDPMEALRKLRKVGAHTFRRVRKDDTLGEPIVFEIGPDGRAVRFVHHSNPSERRAIR
ncbi:MAG: beta-lactamase family protein, partial [Acidobacteriota bacterium]|nr:beta-lactamase family protein [Acidobacteriota bacterium]